MPARSLALPWDADMTTDNEKVLDKVRKLLALANNEAASEGERDNAMRMAHKLLTMHQLEMADVDAHTRASSSTMIACVTWSAPMPP